MVVHEGEGKSTDIIIERLVTCPYNIYDKTKHLTAPVIVPSSVDGSRSRSTHCSISLPCSAWTDMVSRHGIPIIIRKGRVTKNINMRARSCAHARRGVIID